MLVGLILASVDYGEAVPDQYRTIRIALRFCLFAAFMLVLNRPTKQDGAAPERRPGPDIVRNS